ncbi:PAS domain-containing protein [Novosphingobium sp. G106]|uniref:sensor histidine kinase n=1 Tax=Novosphingobium sp. G106 TaxID=2849500 RepID=UPI001C2DDFAB|nr:PAS domain-containing protein [Novosphingobium sp. G106]MBV1691656.1 PAS domain-containing protein [Novosphingobium sp. G106]
MSEGWSSRGAEARRRAIVASYAVEREDVTAHLDRLARLAATICNAPIGLVSLIETDRQRFIGRSGTDLAETPREYAFCDYAMHLQDCMIVADARGDARFQDNPLVTGAPGIRLYVGQPLRSSEGAPLGTLCIIDTTTRPPPTAEQQDALRTLADSAMALLERWRADTHNRTQEAQSRNTIHELEQRFHVLSDVIPHMVWSTLASGRVDYVNRLWCEFTGGPPEESYGERWMQFLHPDDVADVDKAWVEAVDSSGAYEAEYRLRGADGEYRWMLARGTPMLDQGGKVYRWIGTCTDIHEQKAASEQSELLTRELSHRIKNIFAVISGLIALSLRRHPELKTLGGDLQQRVLALGRAHDFVRPHSEHSRPYQSHSSIGGMLDSLMSAYQANPGDRIIVRGDEVRIDDRSATPLALFFHELATNAAKYGALSVGEGHVEIEIDASAPDCIALTWTEIGGPPVLPPSEPGFGASLVEMSITRQLGGTLDYDWRKQGLCVRARIPAEMMAR